MIDGNSSKNFKFADLIYREIIIDGRFVSKRLEHGSIMGEALVENSPTRVHGDI